MGKKILVILYPGAAWPAEKISGRQIFWVVPWEFVPQMIFFACPCMVALMTLQQQ